MPPARDNPQESVRAQRPLPEESRPFLHRLFVASGAERWQLSFTAFLAALARSAAKRFPETWPAPAELEEYFSTLHSKDLALASACAEGQDAAWEEFVSGYRGYLHIAAAAILRCPPSDPAAGELADSLFSDLFGLRENPAEKSHSHSLFRYFHGRSSLKTWLRAILAQRHIDQIRSAKKFDSLDEQPGDGESRRVPEPAVISLAADPRRAEYLERFREALAAALRALAPRDRQRLQLYYVEERTLAEIGRQIGEHESSVSRNLERVRNELRATVEGLLRTREAAANGGPSRPALDDAQVALCIEYAAEEAAIDLDKLFAAPKLQDAPGPNPRVKP
jgi:RNA polymerase sigma-70 factor